MDIILVGADIEENLGIGMIAAAAREAGAQVTVLSLERPEKLSGVARQIVALAPDLLGLSMPDISVVDDAAQPDYSFLDDASMPPDKASSKPDK